MLTAFSKNGGCDQNDATYVSFLNETNCPISSHLFTDPPILNTMKYHVLLLIGVTPFLQLSAESSGPELDNKLKAIMQLYESNKAAVSAELNELKASNEALTRANVDLFKELNKSHDRIKQLEKENALLKTALEQRTKDALRNTGNRSSSTNGKDRLNLNTATADELAALPVIDTALAAQIVLSRPFVSIDEIAAIQHFDSTALKQFAALVTIE